MRHRAEGVSREAAPDSQLRLAEARLYVITPDETPDRVLQLAEAAVRGGADVVQLRHKTLPRGELLGLARKLRSVARHRLLIVNDFVDIALLSGADGVHLGPDDLSPAAARKVAGDRLLIGVSASSPDAVAREADYVGCGPAFITPVKPEKRVVGPEGVAALAARVAVPVFAIGGIDKSNVAQLVAAGVRRACVIRAVAGAADPEAVTRSLRAMLTG